MRYLSFLFALIFFACNTAKSKNETKIQNILFIGNSLTYFHEMPSIVQDMLNETHPGINVEQSAFPGMSLDSHLDNIITSRTENGISTRKKGKGELTKTEKKLLEKSWDIIILQSGTVSFLIPEARQYNIEPAIFKIKELIKNPKCRVLLFSTWPSKVDYPKQYCYSESMINKDTLSLDCCCSVNINNIEQHTALINKAYHETAKALNLEKSNNTDKVYEVLNEYKDLELYEDNIHPNEIGSFLNACVFYQMITGKDALDLKYSGNISEENAKLLKQITK